MFSTFAATTDPSALDDGSYLFNRSNEDLLSLPLSNDSIHLKGSIAPISGLSNLEYGRHSASSSVHYGDSHDTSELSTGQLSSREDREGSTPGTLVHGYGSNYTPSPLQYPFTPSSITRGFSKNIPNKSTNLDGTHLYQVAKAPVTSLEDHPQTTSTFMSGTPQNTSRASQSSVTPEIAKLQQKPVKRRRVNSNSQKGRATELRATSSIPSELSWPEFGRQCILAAENSRLNPFALHPAEYKLLRHHVNRAQVTIYLNIRNAILRLWHRNPLVYVSPEEAAGCTRDKRYFGLANVAYQWLLRNGYINFGCVKVPETSNTIPRMKAKGARQTIIVVGAGMSGLGCARQMEALFAQLGDTLAKNRGERPPKVILLEARPRIGGRVYSHPFLDQSGSTLPPGHRCTAEMGAQIVTGFEHGNPLNAIIRGQLGIPYHGLRDNTILYDHDGMVVDRTQDTLVEKLYNDVLERASVYRNKPTQQRTVEGDRNLILFGREPSDNGGPSIAELEKSNTPLAANDKSTASTTEEKPTSGVEKLAGRAYQLSNGFNADITAAKAAQSMGWTLKLGASMDQTLNLDAIAHASDFPTLGQTMDEGLKQYQSLVDMQPREMRLLNWHHANLEYANAASVNQLSLSGWDQDMGNEFEGQHTEIIGGYQQVPRGLWQAPSKLDVRFSTPIKSIRYDTKEERIGKAVRIECSNGEVYDADRVVVTTPLGVLKSGSVSFQPPLPDWKQGVIERMGFGLLNKIILVYEKVFWEPDRDMFGLLNEAEIEASIRPEDYTKKRGRFYLFWNCLKTSGKPVLVALMAGESAYYAESSSNDQLVKDVTERLASMFAPSLVPLPTEAIVTRWKKDPFACGSYSFVGPRTQAGDYDVMARPHGPLHFAGEATCGTHPATVHGAYLSGLRAAAEVVEAIVGPIQLPSTLVDKKIVKLESPSALSLVDPKRTSEAAASPIRPEGKSARAHGDEDYEAAIIGAILQQIGERPIKPGRSGVNPFLLYTKDFWYVCKKECDEARRASSGNAEAKASKQEIRSAIGLRWRTASEEVKKPYMDQATHAREDATANAINFREQVATWDKEAARIRKEYIVKNPPEGGNEDLILNSRTAIELGANKRVRRL
ncbi:flavin-containing amine oxidoreductase-domain containing protein [Ampelomyces quisqualis]|uniref:Flavin-containing amine oxidoreductase-domain containing protein n=1 Tax=Ampelomyces quisqualis TaxID=50730 RepID=A0A6A5QC29_AMPQU|nr:flavin-containing amine oxidoreductase-domain containing protein [Ampelomyces quisqualis]